MRVVSFVNHMEFEFEGNISKNAICLGDVDNDGQNELIVGNVKGVLAIFKGEKSRPVHVFTDLGMVTAVAVGDIFNFGHNVLIAATGCGICYIYDFENVQLGDPLQDKGELQPVHVQHIPANVKEILVGDVNGDGLAEMVVGLTDRVVRTYRWINIGNVVGGKLNGKLVGQSKWELVDQIGNISLSECSDGSPSVLAAQPGGTYFTLKARTHEDSDQDPFDENVPWEVLTKMSVFYHGLSSARLRNPQIETQIVGNIRLDRFRYNSDGEGNGGGKFEAIGEDGNNLEFSSSFGFVKSHLSSGYGQRKHSTDVNEEGGDGASSSNHQEHSPKPSVGFAVATLDGTLMLVHDGKIKWNLQVDHQLFAVHAMDVTQNGKDEVIACAWDGNTYIVYDNMYCVRFTFPHHVNTFKAGLYGIKGKQVPSLVYVTFNNRIFLYPDITMPHIVTTTVTEVLKNEPRYKHFLEKMGIDASDQSKLKAVNHYLLYGKVK
ncbi:KICSTOR complex protein ITFG2-like [Macrobrachium rosenbergii]|uniref:KICSTOR complex protein ITFG2-like n=1 Tax=Macrobrachium rosenbergii TaxID=79674 RepID=UPI0034D6E332